MPASAEHDGAHPPDRHAYGALLEPCLADARGYARSLLRQEADADDAVQQAAVRALERFASYDQARSFKGWFFAILRNGCMDILRARRSVQPLDGLAATVKAVADGEGRPEWEELATQLERLDGDHAAILRLRYFGELSYDELSQALGIPRGTVMSRLHYARLRLSALMTRTTHDS